MSYIWLGLMVILCIFEAATMQLVSIWLAGGALGAAVVAMCGLNELWQVGVFLGLSAILLAITRPFVKKIVKSREEKTNIDRLIGEKVIITEEVDNIAGKGKTVINGMEWTVRSIDKEKIEEGSIAKIETIEGVKLIVRK